MKHVDLFDAFLRDKVNLNSTRVGELEKSIEAIKNVVEGSSWEPEIEDWAPQGSWAHKTIIKPVDNGEFDADLLVFVHPVDGWTAKDYINGLYDVFKDHGTYKDKVRRFSHCVTITYANERKIDVAPCVINRGGYQRLEVCNRTSDSFELTEPRKYTEWLIGKNNYSGSNSFRKVTRLIKYMRDIKGNFTCSSVLLTTLLGNQIHAWDKGSADFLDTPTALKAVFGRLDDWLQARPDVPKVTNPFLPAEDFAAAWTQTQYANFRNKINKNRLWIDDAFTEANRNDSISKWRLVFGSGFAPDVVLEEARGAGSSAVSRLRASVSEAALFVGDLVAAIAKFGERALPREFTKQPHMWRPTWRRAPSLIPVRVSATLYRSKGYGRLRPVSSLEPLPSGNWLVFSAQSAVGMPISGSDFDIKWRVTNTDEAAAEARCLRGDFYDSSVGGERWEALSYRGVHLVEAFVIRKRDNVLVGESPPFYVVIE